MNALPHLSTPFHTFPHLATRGENTRQSPTTTPSYRGVGVWCGVAVGVVATLPHSTLTPHPEGVEAAA